MKRAYFILLAFFLVIGCRPQFEDSCTTDDDCFEGETCINSQCRPGGQVPDLGIDMTAPDMAEPDMDPPPTPVVSVVVNPPEAQIDVGETFTFTAVPRSASGEDLERTIVWSTSDPSVAQVDIDGEVTGAGEGTATVIATSEGIEGTATITVSLTPVDSVTVTPATTSLALDATLQLTAQTLAEDGRVLSGRTITWSSSDEAIASVSESGLVTANTLGMAVITATAEGVDGTSSITVVPEPVDTVEVTPTDAEVEVGRTVTLTATAFDDMSNVLENRAATWQSGDDDIATVNAEGVVTGVAPGTVSITATVEGQMDSVNVVVVPRSVESVVVAPDDVQILVGNTEQLSATVLDSDGGMLTGRTVTWASDNDAVATVSDGLVTAVSPGTARITATSEGVDGHADVEALAPVATVTISGPTFANINDSIQLDVTLLDGDSNTLTGRDVSWSSDDNSVASVNTSGLVTINGEGSATITATSEGIDGTHDIEGHGPVSQVIITPSMATIEVGADQAFTVELRDSSDHILSGRTVAFFSADQNIVTIDNTGLATGVAEGGPVTITADSEGIEGTATVTVIPAE